MHPQNTIDGITFYHHKIHFPFHECRPSNILNTPHIHNIWKLLKILRDKKNIYCFHISFIFVHHRISEHRMTTFVILTSHRHISHFSFCLLAFQTNCEFSESVGHLLVPSSSQRKFVLIFLVLLLLVYFHLCLPYHQVAHFEMKTHNIMTSFRFGNKQKNCQFAF